MTGYVMRAAGLAGRHEGPGEVPADGAYLKSYDPDGDHDPANPVRGDAEWTDDPAEALVFPAPLAVMEFWRQTSRTRPTRPDGRPNRPLTAISVVCEPDPMGREPNR